MRLYIGAVALAALCSAATAQEPEADRSALITSVLDCRDVADDQARLRCYDAAAAALGEASSAGALVVVDREAVRRTRRGLFGFSVPRLPFFRGDTSHDEEVTEIEGTIQSVRSHDFGKWIVTLADDSVWQTTEPDTRNPAPRPGQSVRIRRAALGSYMLSVEGRRGTRAMRVR
jgi:hypothetical protein